MVLIFPRYSIIDHLKTIGSTYHLIKTVETSVLDGLAEWSELSTLQFPFGIPLTISLASMSASA